MKGEKYYFVVMDVNRVVEIVPVKKNMVTIPEGRFILSFVADNLRATVLNGHDYLSDLETYAVCTTVFDTSFLQDKDFMPERTFFVLPGVFLFCDKTTPAVPDEHTFNFIQSLEIAPKGVIEIAGGNYHATMVHINRWVSTLPENQISFTLDGNLFQNSGSVSITNQYSSYDSRTIYGSIGAMRLKVTSIDNEHGPPNPIPNSNVRIDWQTGGYYHPDLEQSNIRGVLIQTNYMKYDVWGIKGGTSPAEEYHYATVEIKPITIIPSGQNW